MVYETEHYEKYLGWKKYYTVQPIWKQVSREEFIDFLYNYPRRYHSHFWNEHLYYEDWTLGNCEWCNIAHREDQWWVGGVVYQVMINHEDVYNSRVNVDPNVEVRYGCSRQYSAYFVDDEERKKDREYLKEKDCRL